MVLGTFSLCYKITKICGSVLNCHVCKLSGNENLYRHDYYRRLKMILKIVGVSALTGFIWHRIGISGSLLGMRELTFSPITCQKYLD